MHFPDHGLGGQRAQQRKAARVAYGAFAFVVLLWLTIIGTVIYVIGHFVVKFW